jgi:putative SbcD/Mre11-related phosphoesterase
MELAFEDRAMIVRFSETSVLLITDLHLGFEEDLEEQGVGIPPQHGGMLSRIGRLVDKHETSALYVIGDVKHTILTDVSYNWEVIPEFMESLADLTKTTVIPGNHDGDLSAFLPRSVELVHHSGLVVGDELERIGVLHGHSWPSANLLDTKVIVIGHNHPVVRRVRDVSSQPLGRNGRIRYGRTIPVVLKSKLDRNCVRRELGILEVPENSQATLVTLPTFNEMFGGVAVNSPRSTFYGPLFENGCASLEDSEAYSIEGIFLGKVSWLREQSNEMIKSRPSRN